MMKLKYSNISIIALTIILLLSACTPQEEKQFLNKVPYPDSTKVLHKESYKDGTIILYKDKTGFRAGYYVEKKDYLVDSGNIELNPKDGFTWGMNHDPQVPLVLFAGVITDEQIADLL